MPINDVHHHKLAGVLCECPAHKEARAAGVKAHEISQKMLERFQAGAGDEEMDSLCAKLEELNRIARQCDEQQWP